MNTDAKSFQPVVSRASRPCESCNRRTGGTPVPLRWECRRRSKFATSILTHRSLPAYCRAVNCSEQRSDPVPVVCFHTTHWTEVLAAGAEHSPEATEAL